QGQSVTERQSDTERQSVTQGQSAVRRAPWAQAIAVPAAELEQASETTTKWLISTLLTRDASDDEGSAGSGNAGSGSAGSSGAQRVPLVTLRENSAPADAVQLEQTPGRLPTAGWLMLTQELLRNP
ncbi:MAG: hypothetical protein ACKOU6_03885, partial [Planctomycetota bacterium]